MYESTARYYDLIHSWKNYAADVERIMSLVDSERPTAVTLLDAGCGTGRHLELLRDRFDVAGTDGSQAMLDVARGRLGREVPLVQDDLRTFDMGRHFDVAVCLFGGLCLLRTLGDAGRAMRNMAKHLSPGGLLLIEPWVTAERFEEGFIDARAYSASRGSVCVASVGRLEDRIAHLDMHYLIVTTEGVSHLVEPLEAGVWTEAEYMQLFEDAGLEVEHDPVGLDMERGLFVGRSRS